MAQKGVVSQRKSDIVEIRGRHKSNAYKESGAILAAQSRVLHDGRLYKGLSFTIEERQILGIHGLLPPAVMTQEQQTLVSLENINRLPTELDKYMYLISLQERNEKLFYKVVMENIETMMPIIYTPTVGQACQKYGLLFKKPRGLFITINDINHIYEVLCNWPESDVRAICVTDGERILGLGDLGAYGMGIPVGKLALYTACAKIKPHYCLPITLDVGTNNEALLNDPMYIGLRKHRVTGDLYLKFVDEFMHAVRQRFGHTCLIQFEDFGNANAFHLLTKYRNEFCTFNDDIQGTAAVTVAGLLACCWIDGCNRDLGQHKFLFLGAGEAAIGIAKLLVMALTQRGLTQLEALGRIWLVDSKGLVVRNRPKGGVTEEKFLFAKDFHPVDTLEEAVEFVQPSALIGVAASPHAFNEHILKAMAKFNKRPIILALSNPTSKAECTAEDAFKHTDGKAIFASGSPFAAVELNGKTLYTSQCNNAYIFPGLVLGIVLSGLNHVGEELFLLAAQELASMVTQKNLADGRIFPELTDIHSISFRLAVAVVNFAYKHKQALHYPEPVDHAEFVKLNLYSTDYESFLPPTYTWYDCSLGKDDFATCVRQPMRATSKERNS